MSDDSNAKKLSPQSMVLMGGGGTLAAVLAVVSWSIAPLQRNSESTVRQLERTNEKLDQLRQDTSSGMSQMNTSILEVKAATMSATQVNAAAIEATNRRLDEMWDAVRKLEDKK